MTCFKVISTGETIDGVLVVGDTCQTIVIQMSGLQGPPGPQGEPGAGINLLEAEILNDQTTPAPIEGLIFNPALYYSATINYTVVRKTDTELLIENGFMLLTNGNDGWDLTPGPISGGAGVLFSIDPETGQVEYTSTDLDGVISVQLLSYSVIQRVGV